MRILKEKTHVGAWYKVFNGDDKPARRLKLSLIIDDNALCIFVDRRGNKVIEKAGALFAEELDNKKSTMIADHSTFDSALGNVINALAA